MKRILLLVSAICLTFGCYDDSDIRNGGSQDDDEGGAEDGSQTISKGPITLSLGEVTATTATFTARLDVDMMADYQEVGLVYSKDDDMDVESETITKVKINKESYSETFTGLQYDTDFYYTVYTLRNNVYSYGATQAFKTNDITISVDDVKVTTTTATFTGKVVRDEADASVKVGIQYSAASSFESTSSLEVTPEEDGAYNVTCDGLVPNKEYYCRTYVCQNSANEYSETMSFTTNGIVPSGYTNLSSVATANCYIISQNGSYCFLVAKGNPPSELLHPTVSASLLWESFGTSVVPSVGELIKSVSYSDGYITFQTADVFKEGNAVIAAKDANGNILWSWHIWFTDQPQAHVYKKDAGTMMDRNLGATSATKGDVGALGLLYQWGRKDPFLGSSSISSSTLAKSTITWPSDVLSDSSNGTIEYATAHPTTYIDDNSNNYDWYYTGDSSTDNTRWTTSETAKSIYDPCPAGWRVPDGGSNGIWSKAGFYDTTYDSTNEGISFSILSPSTTWYPASGFRLDDGHLLNVGYGGYYWSASPDSDGSSYAYFLRFYDNGDVDPWYSLGRARGFSVRCLQE